MFILEGLPANVLGVTAFFLLTDWPSEARWLVPEQRQWIKWKLEEEKPTIRKSVTLRQTLRSRALSHWFIQEDRAKATSNFMAAIPMSLVKTMTPGKKLASAAPNTKRAR